MEYDEELHGVAARNATHPMANQSRGQESDDSEASWNYVRTEIDTKNVLPQARAGQRLTRSQRKKE